jgi:type I restriction enzyme M protein
MFYGAGIPACYLVVNTAKPEPRRDRVLFIDGSECFERQDTKNVMRDADIDRIATAYLDEADQDGFSSWVDRDEVRGRRYNLSVRRYVRGADSDEEDALSLAEAIEALSAAQAQRIEAEAQVEALLNRLEGDEE